MSKYTSKKIAALKPSTKVEEEKIDPAKFAFNMVEVTGGKQFLGQKAECVKSGVTRWKRPFAILVIDDEEEFVNPAHLKIVKPLPEARVAAIKAKQEADREAVIMIGGIVKQESEKAILFSHHAWFRPMWFPKSMVTKIGDHDDGKQTIFEFPLWKIKRELNEEAFAALESLQSGYEKMLAPKAVPGKTSLIKRRAK